MAAYIMADMELIRGIINFIGIAILTVIGIAVLFLFGWATGVNMMLADAGMTLGTWEGYGVAALISFLTIYMACKSLAVIHSATCGLHGGLLGWLGALIVVAVMFAPIIYLFTVPSTPAT